MRQMRVTRMVIMLFMSIVAYRGREIAATVSDLRQQAVFRSCLNGS